MNLHWLIAYDHYAYAVFAVVGTFLAVYIIYWLMTRSGSAEWVRSLRGVAPPFINVVGVLFALTLAFIANDTWSAHDRATNAVYREADSLRSLMVLAARLEQPLQGELRQALVEYAEACAEEWPLLARRQAGSAVGERADALLLLLGSRRVAQAAGDTVQALMLRKASDMRDDRDLRIGLSQMHINPLKWLGMAFLGLLTLLSIAAVHVENPRAALVAILLFALSAAPTAAIVLIQGNPFQQPSSVSPQPLMVAVRR